MAVVSLNEINEKAIEMYWVRLFQRSKKQNTIKDRTFVTDKNTIDWLSLSGRVLEIKAEIAEKKTSQLANKRRKLHNELHLQADKDVVTSILTSQASSSSSLDSKNEIDDFFQSGPKFSIIMLQKDLEQWRENSERIDRVHKQDLLYYNILDFVTTRSDAAIRTILCGQYTVVMEYFKSLYTPQEAIEQEVNDMMILNDKAIYNSCKKIVKGSFENNKSTEICSNIYRLIKKQFRDDINVFTDPSINEYHITMAFIFPLFDEAFDDISKKILYQKWGESKLICAKQDEHNALADAHRRTPGPSIDGIFTLPRLDHVEFVVLEVSGGPACDDFEHFLGDRNKIAKNLKLMKHIASLRSEKLSSGLASLKLYGLQVYKNEVFVYFLTSPITNKYMFLVEMKFKLPIRPLLLNTSFPLFMQHVWKLKRMILSSFKNIERFLLEEPSNSDNGTMSNISSPYVSQAKRKEN